MMKKGKLYIVYLLATIVLAQTNDNRHLQTTSYTTTASRSSQLANLCTNSDRSSLYSQYGLNGNIQYTSQFTNFFNLDSTIFNLFLNLDVIGINNSLKSNALGYAVYIIPAFVGPALLLLLAPFLLICLCCPCRFCQRKKLQYTGCQKMWPVLFTMAVGGVVIGSCFTGLFSNYKISNGYQQLSCSGIIAMDDALNGAQSYNGSNYFAGIATINTQLQTLTSGNFNYILGNLTSLSSTGNYTSKTLNLMNGALYNISVISDPSTSNLTLNYSTPFASQTPTGSISSTFPSILGSQNYNSTLVGSAYASMNNAYTNLSSITSKVDSFQSSSSAFLTSVNQMINETAKTISSLQSSLITTNDIFTTQNYFSNLYYLETLFYGIILGLVALYLLGLTIFSCCDNLSCRYFLYFLGFLLFFITLAVFGAFFFLSYSSAIFYSGCNYFSESINNPDTFISNMQKIGISSQIASQYSVCLSGQSGDIISKVSGEQNKNYLDSLRYLMNNITSFNGTDLSNTISINYSPLATTLSHYANSQTLDITDTASIQELNYISTSSNFNCSGGDFTFDSWVPSVHQTDNAIACKSPSGMPNADNTTCATTSNFNSAVSGCQGCMDTFSLLYNANSQAAAYNILNGRYSGCSTFNGELSNVWQNYYLIKKNVLSSVLSRESTARQSIQATTQSVNLNLNPTFKNTLSSLYSTSGSILTPNYGMLWGLNCQVIGQDITLFQKTACTNTFSYSYFHRILTLIISFSLLVLLCCNTCTIFRREKQILYSKFQPSHSDKNRAVPYMDPLSDARLQNNYL